MLGLVVVMFFLNRVAHRTCVCCHMWLLSGLSMCWYFGPVGLFFALQWLGSVLLGDLVLFSVGLRRFVSFCLRLFVFGFACQFVCLMGGW